MSTVEALRFAFDAIDTTNTRQARVWLSARGVQVTQADIDRAVAPRPTPVAPVSPTPRQDPDRTPTARKSTAPPKPSPTKRATPRQVAPTPEVVAPASTGAVDGHSPAAVANAAELRRRYPNSLPDADNPIRQATGWSLDRVKKARDAYAAGADRQTPTGATS